MIDLKPHPEGTILPVHAHAGARRNEIRGQQNGRLKVSVTQSPEQGKANKALIALLSQKLSLRKSQLALLSGETSPKKQFLVRGLTPTQLAQRIAQLGILS
jgi:uncharacterized protein (TIGR00251 family)